MLNWCRALEWHRLFITSMVQKAKSIVFNSFLFERALIRRNEGDCLYGGFFYGFVKS